MGASFLGDRDSAGALISACTGEAVGASGNGGCLGGASENILEKDGIGLAFEARDTFVVAVVVRIDIDEAVERIAGGLDLACFEVEVEEADESVEIFRFAVEFLVEVRDNFGDRQRHGIQGRHLVHVGDEFGLAAVAAHYVFRLVEERGGFGFVAIQDVSARQFEELREAFGLLLVVGFKNFTGAIEAVRAEKSFAEDGYRAPELMRRIAASENFYRVTAEAPMLASRAGANEESAQ